MIHEENIWLERVEKMLNSSKIGIDAEELSEELDVKWFRKISYK